MTDPTTPTTEAGRKHVLNGWDHDEREQRRALVLAIEAEAAASALLALRAEVEGMGDPWAQSDGRPDKVSVARVLAAIDRIAKAEPEPKCEHGVPVALACRACRDAKAKPEGESRG